MHRLSASRRAQAQRYRLAEFYKQLFRPLFHSDVRPRTVSAYLETLRHWGNLTPDPPIDEMDVTTLANFKGSLVGDERGADWEPAVATRQLVLFSAPLPRKVPGLRLRRSTANKHLRHLEHLLAKAGPPERGNRDALGIVDYVPWVRPYKLLRRHPRAAKWEVVAAIYRASHCAVYPRIRGVIAHHWWKALICASVTIGFRRQGLFALEWADVDLQEHEVSLSAEGDKCHEDRRKPIPHILVAHLVRIRTAERLVFGWPHSEQTFYRQWHRLQTASGLDRSEHIKLHDLKRTCLTAWSQIASPKATQFIADHAGFQTTMGFYVDGEQEARQKIDDLPLPDCMFDDVGLRCRIS